MKQFGALFFIMLNILKACLLECILHKNRTVKKVEGPLVPGSTAYVDDADLEVLIVFKSIPLRSVLQWSYFSPAATASIKSHR